MGNKNKKIAYLIVVALVVGLGVFLLAGDKSSIKEQSKNFFLSDAVGKNAPDFSLSDIDGNTVRLGDFKGKNVVLFFNEGEMCYPACWNQIEALGNDPRFNSTSIAALSIVVDTPDQWKRIESEMPQYKKATILFDNGGAVSSAYGVLSLPSSMHPGRYPGHTYFVIDKNGIIQFFLDDPTMAVRNNQLIDEINKLK